MNICKTIAVVALAGSLAGCSAVDLISKGMAYSKAVATDLERDTGVKPEVGFNWHNGILNSVTINFHDIPKQKTLSEIAELSRASIKSHFKQVPQQIVVGFTLEPE